MSTIEERARLVFSLRQAGVRDQKVLNAIEKLDRRQFVDAVFAERAFEDVPLPIGAGQTISAPSVVARMMQALAIEPKSTVLEIGTGSGYQTALLAMLARRVFSVERIKSLAETAKANLHTLSFNNVLIAQADGTLGLPNQAPFDRILITAAAEDVPSLLLEQLKPGGIMVLPVGQSDTTQTLLRVEKTAKDIVYSEFGSVKFVPLLTGREEN